MPALSVGAAACYPAAAQPAAPLGGGETMTQLVLVVDDEPNIVLSLEFLMKQAGLEVRTAVDGRAALDECLNRFDLGRDSNDRPLTFG